MLDLSRVFSGPFAGQMLADFGADVIKVERPGRGDDVRHQGLRVKDEQGRETKETSSFLAVNRGKRSITIDISQPAGQALVRQLAECCDIVIENFKAGDLARYGLDYSALKAVNPRLVYCSITGFGQSGPYSHLPGYDPIFQSMSGLMSVTGHADDAPGGGPLRVGYSVERHHRRLLRRLGHPCRAAPPRRRCRARASTSTSRCSMRRWRRSRTWR